jgi:hypothetical protein
MKNGIARQPPITIPILKKDFAGPYPNELTVSYTQLYLGDRKTAIIIKIRDKITPTNPYMHNNLPLRYSL